jgi:hypothetical protein
MARPLFRLGKIISTSAALQALREARQDPFELVNRHQAGDWGEVSRDVRQANDLSARSTFSKAREKILSTYTLRTGLRIWILTEADRSVTTLFRPEEFGLIETNVMGPLVTLDPSEVGSKGSLSQE